MKHQSPLNEVSGTSQKCGWCPLRCPHAAWTSKSESTLHMQSSPRGKFFERKSQSCPACRAEGSRSPRERLENTSNGLREPWSLHHVTTIETTVRRETVRILTVSSTDTSWCRSLFPCGWITAALVSFAVGHAARTDQRLQRLRLSTTAAACCSGALFLLPKYL